ncbi:hypothetical protein RI138_00270 [Streptomyces sp. C11-1]|uniref:DUF11 domain-containing protein n=1 Tax=Streptomyces durocortorensis TaxID=2811104 RepID=A0ABY9VRI8_9ACTN|nr:hypothetical protein [Streptomyces durocortorensis]WNF25356.1 hypothetical protein RI138_00270 [Streptomyces durocortorensis]
MRPVTIHPFVRLGASVVATAGILLAGLSAPASATESDQLWIEAPYETSLQTGAETGTPVDVGLYHDNDNFTVTDGRLTVDVSGIADVGEVTWPENCVPSGTTAVCTVAQVPTIGPEYSPQVRLDVRAADGVEAGAQGRITYAATATGGPEGSLEAPLDSFETTLTVTSGPDLVLGGVTPIENTAPGTVHTVPLSVTNKGKEPAQGFTLDMTASYGIGFGSRHDACAYTQTGGDYAPMARAQCAFDQVLQPGDTVTLPQPLKISVAGHALKERLDISVQPGGGAPDSDEQDNYESLTVNVPNTADFAVRGSRVSGAAGDTVKAALTFRNKGPGWVGNLGSGDSVALVDFTVPEGVTVTRAPTACQPRTEAGGSRTGRVGAPRYICEMPYWVLENTVRTFRFDLRIDTVIPDTKGRVSLQPVITGTGFPHDPKPGNNKGWVTVNPTPTA